MYFIKKMLKFEIQTKLLGKLNFRFNLRLRTIFHNTNPGKKLNFQALWAQNVLVSFVLNYLKGIFCQNAFIRRHMYCGVWLALPLRGPVPPLRQLARACATHVPPDLSWWRKFCVPAPASRYFRAAQIGGVLVGVDRPWRKMRWCQLQVSTKMPQTIVPNRATKHVGNLITSAL